ncbi:glycosyltransferase [Phycisphaeraceae bacterium D3-23]
MEKRLFQKLNTTSRYPYLLSEYVSRVLWVVVSKTVYRLALPRSTRWRRFWLVLFGAEIHPTCNIRPGVKIVHPWLLTMGEYSCLGDNVNVYNLGTVTIGAHTVVSQDTHLCAGTHDYTRPSLPLKRLPIMVGSGVWVCAEAFIGPGVKVGDNALVAARAVVFEDVPEGMIVAGNPAQALKPRPEPVAAEQQGIPTHRATRVLHTTASISRRAGGVSWYLWELASQHAANGIDIAVSGMTDQYTVEDAKAYSDRLHIITRKPTLPIQAGYSHGLNMRLSALAHNYDLIHVHGLRTLLNMHARRLSKHYDRPLIISPHGQLYPQVLAQNQMRKAAMAKLFVDANLDAASCIHTTSMAEAEHVRAYGLTVPIAVVPIGVNLDTFDCDAEAARPRVQAKYPCPGKQHRVLFLSLLHAKKGLSRLAQVWSVLAEQHPDWQLMIAGPDAGYEAQARADFERSGRSDSVTWTGPVYGQEKADLLTGCDLLVLPSDWENFGIVVIEALAAGTPVIATKGAPWEQLPERHCGWWVDAEVEPIRRAMAEAMSLGDEDRRAMGQRGRALVEEQYTWDRCADQMLELYKAAITKGPWPDFVQTDQASCSGRDA